MSATFIALRTGELDAASRAVPPELVREFAQSPTIGLVKTEPLSVLELRPNWEQPPFDRPALRQALSLAIDRQALVDTVLLGQGRPGTRGYSHPDSRWTNPRANTPFDAARAAALLDGLRFADRDGDGLREDEAGSPIRYTLIVSAATPAWVRVAELIAQQYRRLGIHVTLQALEAGVFNQRSAARDYDLLLAEGGAHSSADPDQFIVSHQVGYLWRLGTADTRRDDIIARWKQTATLEARKQVGFELQDLMNLEPTSIGVLYPDQYWAFRKASYTNWIDSPGYGVVHKWSFLPASAVPAGLRAAE
jgi:peptide/nickel transport system substrate-binding protein